MGTLLAIATLLPQVAFGAIALDAQSSLPRLDYSQFSDGGAVSFQSGAFSTTGGGELIVACATIPNRTNPSITSTSNLLWSLAKQSGSVNMWVAWANAPLTNERVTITAPAGSGNSYNGLVITALTGASSALGATASSSTGSYSVGGPTAITTTGMAGSWILDCMSDGATSVPYGGADGTVIGTQMVMPGSFIYGMGLLRYPTPVVAGSYTMSAGGPGGWFTTAVVEVEPQTQASGPYPSVAPSTYTSPQTVSLSCASPNPTIRYTTDGSTPNGSSPIYSAPVAITAAGTSTVKALCQSAGFADSPVETFAYTLVFVTPIALDTHPSLPRVDSSQFSDGAAVSFQSGTFSTTGGGELIIACATTWGRTNPSIASMSNLPWTLAKQTGGVSMWVAWANAPLVNERVTITAPAGSGYSANGLVIGALTGASSAIGATASFSTGTYSVGGPTAITTTGVAGSWILDCLNDGDRSVPYSGANGTTIGTQLVMLNGSNLYGMGLLRYPTPVIAGSYTMQAGGPMGGYTTAVIEVQPQTQASGPYPSVAPSTYTSPQTVSLSCASPNPTIRYTTDGSTPDGSSPVYSTPIAVSSAGTSTVKALCQSAGFADSPVETFVYTLVFVAPISLDAHPSLPRKDYNQSPFGGTVSFQSGPFSTTSGGELIVACASVPGIGRTNPSISSTSNLPWTLAKQSGGVNLWVAQANAPLVNERVTITAPAGSGYSDNGLVITALTGVSSALGATAAISAVTGVGGPTAITTTGTAGSWILDCTSDGVTSVPYSGASGTTIGTQLVWQDGSLVYGMGLLRYPTPVNAGPHTVQAGGPPGTYTTAVVEVQAAPTANVPSTSPVAGAYAHAISVALSCSSPSPTIRYTNDGSPPTVNSAVYSAPMPVTAPGTTTLKALCQSPGYPDSPAGVFTYNLLIAATPIPDPAPGPYVVPQLISLSCATANSTIYYTTDGSDPTSSSTIYSAPFSIGSPGSSATVKALCEAPGLGDSAVAAFAYAFECVPFLACDDGNPCTYGDTCNSQEQCTGTVVACVDDQCNVRACNGTFACTVTPKDAAACDDGNACTYGDHCSSSGSCVGATVNCSSDACATRMCNGTSACTVQPQPAGISCKVSNDGFPCADACDGAGHCVMGATVERGATCPFATACGQVCDGVSPYCQPAE